MTSREQIAHNKTIEFAQQFTARQAWWQWQHETFAPNREFWREVFTICCERAR